MRLVALLLLFAAAGFPAGPIKVLIIDGQNNHDWKATTPLLKKMLETNGMFSVDAATTPPAGGDMTQFKPAFSEYGAILLNYTGDPWTPDVQTAFDSYVRNGGGFVVYHAADNAFPEWREFNEMIGLGGWGKRDASAGPYLRFRDGKMFTEDKPGRAGHHGKQHPYEVVHRDLKHPITRGLPEKWMHVQDELYDNMRGPAKNITLLATAWSDPATGGTGEHEPMLFTIAYGKGRVFHTMLGHGPEAIACVGFQTTLLRGTEWVATGRVTQKPPADFPTATETRTR